MSHPALTRSAALRRRQRRLEGWLKELERKDHQFFLARLITFGAGAATALLILFLGPPALRAAAPLAGVALFSGVVILHRRLDQVRVRFLLAHKYTSQQLARASLDWDGIPDPPAIAASADHPFAADLNLLGRRSVHQLLDTATSRHGSERLADWLLDPTPDLAQIRRRQGLALELLPLDGFRSRLAMRGMLVKQQAGGHWDGEKLLAWLGKHPPGRRLAAAAGALSALAAVNVFLYLMNTLGLLPAYWSISLAIYAGAYLYLYRDYQDLFSDTYTLGRSLEQFRAVLEYLERYPLPAHGELARLLAPYRQAEQRPSRFLRRITWISSAASLGDNQFLSILLNLFLPWNLIFTLVLSRYKAALLSVLPGWLEAWYDLEALNSLANFASLNPCYAFPKVEEHTPTPGEPILSAQGLGHPLLAHETRVCNDFSIEKPGEIILLTGSNMSGKSTFLRTLGVNLCLAYAGSPVAAASLITRAFRIFTCIQVSDSLSDGISYFYAEVRRLKALLESLKADSPFPLFYLIDEIYRGTNNRERRIGSQAYLQALARGNGAGVVSTHDLELAQLPGNGLPLVNYHFREEILDQRMVFDYRLRHGPSPTTNALKIMEMEGLLGEDGGKE